MLRPPPTPTEMKGHCVKRIMEGGATPIRSWTPSRRLSRRSGNDGVARRALAARNATEIVERRT